MYFEKSELMTRLISPLMGRALILSKSDEEWKIKRKSMSSAFYKNKLRKLIEVVKDTTLREMKEWKDKG